MFQCGNSVPTPASGRGAGFTKTAIERGGINLKGLKKFSSENGNDIRIRREKEREKIDRERDEDTDIYRDQDKAEKGNGTCECLPKALRKLATDCSSHLKHRFMPS